MNCPFCTIDQKRVAFEDEIIVALWDVLPSSPGHLLIVPKAHTATWQELSALQKTAIWSAIERAQQVLRNLHNPDGYNVGFNEGLADQQSHSHFQLHIVPRYEGDTGRLGISAQNTNASKSNATLSPTFKPSHPDSMRRLVTGDTDHLLPHLRRYLDQSTTCDIAVAFLMDSGTNLIIEHMRDFLTAGGKARILVGDYLEITQPIALRKLNDLTCGCSALTCYQFPKRTPSATLRFDEQERYKSSRFEGMRRIRRHHSGRPRYDAIV